MTNEERTIALLSLRLVAAKAAKLASDVEGHRLWPGTLQRDIDEIDRALEDARRMAARER